MLVDVSFSLDVGLYSGVGMRVVLVLFKVFDDVSVGENGEMVGALI